MYSLFVNALSVFFPRADSDSGNRYMYICLAVGPFMESVFVGIACRNACKIASTLSAQSLHATVHATALGLVHATCLCITEFGGQPKFSHCFLACDRAS